MGIGESRRGGLTIWGDPSSPVGSLPLPASRSIATLHRVRRDGNSKRRYGHVSPYLGKLGPLDTAVLEHIASAAAGLLDPDGGRTLVVGLAESSLVLAWALMDHLPDGAGLVFTTRHPIDHPGARTFQEPHSHGPAHYLALRSGPAYDRVVIVEDEITTGVTAWNLIVSLHDVADCFHLVCLSDLRRPDVRKRLDALGEAHGLHLRASCIRTSATPAIPRPGPAAHPRAARPWNPYNRADHVLEAALRSLHQTWREACPGALYVIGECIDLGLAFWDRLPPENRPIVQHVTRSPWRVDGAAVLSRLDLGGATAPVRHFLYNWVDPGTPCALVLSDSSTREIADQLLVFLRARGIGGILVEVPLG